VELGELVEHELFSDDFTDIPVWTALDKLSDSDLWQLRRACASAWSSRSAASTTRPASGYGRG
jgi:hypothetical protein